MLLKCFEVFLSIFPQMLNFDLTDIASLLEVPGLYDLLNKVILTQISNYLVLPNMLSFSFSDKVDVKQLRYIEPKVWVYCHVNIQRGHTCVWKFVYLPLKLNMLNGVKT